MLESNSTINGSDFLNEDLSNVKKYDMKPRTIDYESDKILNIVSDELFVEGNNVKTEYKNHFDSDESSTLNTNAKKIRGAFEKKIKDAGDLKKTFIEIFEGWSADR